MKDIKVFSVFKIKRELNLWTKRFKYLKITFDIPSADCYLIYKQNTSNCWYPYEALFESQRGLVEGWINGRFDRTRIFQPTEFESQLERWNEEEKIFTEGIANEATGNIEESTLIT